MRDRAYHQAKPRTPGGSRNGQGLSNRRLVLLSLGQSFLHETLQLAVFLLVGELDRAVDKADSVRFLQD